MKKFKRNKLTQNIHWISKMVNACYYIELLSNNKTCWSCEAIQLQIQSVRAFFFLSLFFIVVDIFLPMGQCVAAASIIVQSQYSHLKIFSLYYIYTMKLLLFFSFIVSWYSAESYVLFSKFFVSLLNLYTKRDTEDEKKIKCFNQINGNILCVRRIAPKNGLSIIETPNHFHVIVCEKWN